MWSADVSLPAGELGVQGGAQRRVGRELRRDNGGGDNIPLTLAADDDACASTTRTTRTGSPTTSTTRIATAAGSFQSELGCPGDWQPDCLRSWLQDVDGDGIDEFDARPRCPPGSYEWKVALDEAWDENYGAGGVAGGANIAFTVTAAGQRGHVPLGRGVERPDRRGRRAARASRTATSELVTPPVRTPASDEVVYFVMTDRFADGAAGNNRAGSASGDRSRPRLRPDRQGLVPRRRPRRPARRTSTTCEDLGVTALWITPPFTNRWVQDDSAGYHGYWQVDYTQIDPHLGTQRRDDRPRRRRPRPRDEGLLRHRPQPHRRRHPHVRGRRPSRTATRPTTPYRMPPATVFDDRDYVGSDDVPGARRRDELPLHADVRTPARTPPSRCPAWLNDRTLYHNRGDSTFAGESSLYGDFVGLDDLFTEHPTVVDGMIDIHTAMIDMFDVDGFRVDTVKHVNDELWEEFVPAVQAHAAAAGKAEFPIFGEVFDGNPEFLSRFSTDAAVPLDARLPVPRHGRRHRRPSRGRRTRLRDTVRRRRLVHRRRLQRPRASPSSSATTTSAASAARSPSPTRARPTPSWSPRARLAQMLNFTTRGAPVVYYGDEQGFTGDGGDQDARQDMFPSQVASYNDDDLIGTDATTAEDNFDPTHPLYLAISELAGLRADHVALRQGAQLHRYSEAGAGHLRLQPHRRRRRRRSSTSSRSTTSEVADTATFPTDSPATTFTPILPDGGAPITVGCATARSPSQVATARRRDLPRRDADRAATTSPTRSPSPSRRQGAEVTGRVPVRADVGGGDFAEVTFAVSVDGARFEVLGVDDNAPYAVYHDVAGLAAGAPLRYRAIVADVAGNLNAAGTRRSSARGNRRRGPGTRSHCQRTTSSTTRRPTASTTAGASHAWGDIAGTIDWTTPRRVRRRGRLRPLRVGRAAAGRRRHGARSSTAATARTAPRPDRFIDPSRTPEVWLRSGDPTIYTSQAAADGFATIRYHRADGDYDGWGLHLWGDAIDPADGTEWDVTATARRCRRLRRVLAGAARRRRTRPSTSSSTPATTRTPARTSRSSRREQPTAWIVSGDETIHRTPRVRRGRGDDPLPPSRRRLRRCQIQRLQGLLGTPRLGRRGVAEPVLAGTAATGAHGPVRHRLRGRRSWTGPRSSPTSSTAATPRIPVRTCPSTSPRDGYEVWQLQGADPGAALRPARSSAPRPAAATSPRSGRTGCPRTPSCGALLTTRRRRTACTTPRQAGWSWSTTG